MLPALKKLLLGLSFISGLCAGTLSAQQGFQFLYKVKSVRIPIEVYNNLILVKVKVNGTPPLNFIIDTGVRTSLLTEPALLPLMRVKDMSTIPIRGLGGGEVIDAKLALGIKFDMVGISGENMRMIVLPDGAASYSPMFGKPVVGIIGYDLFRNFVVEINYQHKYMRLHDPSRYRPPKRSTGFPIQLIRAKPYLETTIVDANQDTLKTHWLMDTGSSQAISIYHKDLEMPQETIPAFIGTGLSGDMFGQLARVKQLKIGNFEFQNVIAGYPDTSSIRWVIEHRDQFTNLGAEILSRFHVVLDYPHKMVYLRKNARYKSPFVYNTCGIETLAIGAQFNQFQINYIRPDSPAESAGFLIGDQIISINGISVHDLKMPDVHNRLNRREGHRICLRVLRNGEKIRQCFVLESGI